VVSWLRDEGLTVGVMGYSLGGYVAGLLACVRDDLAAVVIGAAGDSVVEVAVGVVSDLIMAKPLRRLA